MKPLYFAVFLLFLAVTSAVTAIVFMALWNIAKNAGANDELMSYLGIVIITISVAANIFTWKKLINLVVRLSNGRYLRTPDT